MDTEKRDMTLTYEGRDFAVRAFLDESDPADAGWHALILAGRTPLPHALGPSLTPADCFGGAIRFLTAFAEVHPAAPVAHAPHAAAAVSGGMDGRETNGGGIARDRDGMRVSHPAS